MVGVDSGVYEPRATYHCQRFRVTAGSAEEEGVVKGHFDRARLVSGIAACVVAAGLAISGCGSDSARLAADDQRPASEVDAIDDIATTDAEVGTDVAPTNSERVAALFKGVRVCVRNETGTPIPSIYVRFTAEEFNAPPTSADDGYLNAAGDKQQRCGVQNLGGLNSNAVAGRIFLAKPGAADYNFEAFNEVGYPKGILRSSFSPTAYQNNCLDLGFSENESRTYDDGLYEITMLRQPDSALKEFLITIKPTKRPSSDGRSRAC